MGAGHNGRQVQMFLKKIKLCGLIKRGHPTSIGFLKNPLPLVWDNLYDSAIHYSIPVKTQLNKPYQLIATLKIENRLLKVPRESTPTMQRFIYNQILSNESSLPSV